MEGYWEQGFWHRENFFQRVENKVWKQALLNEDDRIIVRGKVRQLVAKNLGYGVVEVSLKPLEAE